MADLPTLTRQLAQAHRELGELLAAEKDGRVRSYAMSEESSVSGREKAADIAVLPLSVDIIKLKAEIRALEVEWQYLMKG